MRDNGDKSGSRVWGLSLLPGVQVWVNALPKGCQSGASVCGAHLPRIRWSGARLARYRLDTGQRSAVVWVAPCYRRLCASAGSASGQHGLQVALRIPSISIRASASIPPMGSGSDSSHHSRRVRALGLRCSAVPWSLMLPRCAPAPLRVHSPPVPFLPPRVLPVTPSASVRRCVLTARRSREWWTNG